MEIKTPVATVVQGFRGHRQVSMSVNKWAKPIAKSELPPRVHLQKASKIKQIWELWSMNAALAMSTWSDVAVTFWHQCITSLRRAIKTGDALV